MGSRNKIFVVDDDQRMCRVLERILTREGYQVDTAHSALEARKRLAVGTPDLLLLDIVIPDASGLDIARELRQNSNIPIIMLSGKTDPVDKVVGLEIGADDYITKPFDERELLARVRSVLRRSKPCPNAAAATPAEWDTNREVAVFDGWKLDLKAQELRSPDDQHQHLTGYEFRLLASLATHPNQAFDRNRIMSVIADRDWSPHDRGVDVLVSKLRKKIEADPKQPRLIKTVRGTGYIFATRVVFQSQI